MTALRAATLVQEQRSEIPVPGHRRWSIRAMAGTRSVVRDRPAVCGGPGDAPARPAVSDASQDRHRALVWRARNLRPDLLHRLVKRNATLYARS